jgi:uncharacterized protein involved in exopolysaccharide biosynthesis
VIGGAVTAWVAYLPDRYRASALIILRPQNFPEAAVRLDTDRAEAQIRVVHQVLLSRSLLGRVVDDFHLYPELRATRTSQEIIETMRKNLTVQLKGDDVFMVTYQGRDPKVVTAVTNHLAESFVDLLRTEVKTDPISHRVLFLETRLKELDRQLADLSLLYTANYPEVLGAKRQRQEVAAELEHERSRGVLDAPSIEGGARSSARREAQILDRAILPDKPSQLDRRVLAVLGFVLGAGIGIGWALLRSWMDHAFRDPYDLEAVTHIPVLGVVCRIDRPTDQRYRSARVILGLGSGAVTAGGVWYVVWNFQEVARWATRWWSGVW